MSVRIDIEEAIMKNIELHKRMNLVGGYLRINYQINSENRVTDIPINTSSIAEKAQKEVRGEFDNLMENGKKLLKKLENKTGKRGPHVHHCGYGSCEDDCSDMDCDYYSSSSDSDDE